MSAGDLDEFDVFLEQVVDDDGEVEALGIGDAGEGFLHVGVEVDRQVQFGTFAEELAALAFAEIVFVAHGITLRTVGVRARWPRGPR